MSYIYYLWRNVHVKGSVRNWEMWPLFHMLPSSLSLHSLTRATNSKSYFSRVSIVISLNLSLIHFFGWPPMKQVDVGKCDVGICDNFRHIQIVLLMLFLHYLSKKCEMQNLLPIIFFNNIQGSLLLYCHEYFYINYGALYSFGKSISFNELNSVGTLIWITAWNPIHLKVVELSTSELIISESWIACRHLISRPDKFWRIPTNRLENIVWINGFSFLLTY